MKKRILHIVHELRHSGAEMLVRDLCLRHVANGKACAISSYTPTAGDFQQDESYLTARGVHLHISQKPLAKLGRVRFLRRVIQDFTPDIIYGHSVIPALYGRLALPLHTRAEFVSVLHSACNDEYYSKLWRYPEQLLTWRAARVFAVSERGALNYRVRIPYGAKVFHVPNGIDLDRFRNESRERSRHALGLTEQDRLVLQVGRLSSVKQQLVTIRSLTPLLIDRPTFHIWLAGLSQEPSYEAQIMDEIRASPVKDRIKLLGSRSDIPELLSAADVFVMPSIAEAHSIAVLEALATGVSVVTSNIEAFRPFAQWAGVRLIEPGLEEDYRAAVGFLADGLRYPNRDMKKFDIERTVAAYETGFPIS